MPSLGLSLGVAFPSKILGGGEDPLAGITFALRLQTHNGDNVPLGLYQDVSCTVPATMDGDPIAAWRGELMGAPITLTQSDEQKQPILLYVNGVPTVFPDGVDDVLIAATPIIAQPFTMVGQVNFLGDSSAFYIPFDSAASAFCYMGRTVSEGRFQVYAGAVLDSPIGSIPLETEIVLSCNPNGATSRSWADGALLVSGDAGTDGLDGVRIGCAKNNTAFFLGTTTGFFVGVLTDQQRIATETFAATLSP